MRRELRYARGGLGSRSRTPDPAADTAARGLALNQAPLVRVHLNFTSTNDVSSAHLKDTKYATRWGPD